MSAAVYDTLAFGMRYWFLFLIAAMFLIVLSISMKEYREHKYIMGEVGSYIGYLEILEGPEEALGLRVGLMKENLIGSGKTADIVIEEESVAKAHASIYLQKGHLMLRPYAKNQTKINGRRASRDHEIFSGDIVQFGNVQALVYRKEAEEAEEADE